MLSLDFYYFLNRHYAVEPIYIHYFNQIVYINRQNSNITFDEMWDMLIQIINMASPEYTVYVKQWKSDIFMSIYAALTYTITEPLTRQSIVKFITELQGLPDAEDSIRASLSRSCRELRDVQAAPLFRLTGQTANWPYFINACEEAKPIKTFHPYDMYCYLKSYKKLPFWKENLNGITLSKWYKNTSDLFKEIHQYDNNVTDINFQFRDYVFEQIFAPCRFTAILSGFADVFAPHFESIDSPLRERAIIYSTIFAKLPSDSLKDISQAFSPTLKQLLQLDTYEQESAEKMKSQESLFQFLRLPYYFFPSCQILLANIMYCIYLSRYENQILLKNMKNDLHEYLNQNIKYYYYTKKVENALKHFETMHYPINTCPPLTKELRNNATAKSFGYNFTYNFYSYDSDVSGFDLNWIPNHGYFVSNKFQTVLQRISMTNNIYTFNFLQAMNPHSIIIPISYEK
ncbi:MAG: hypothetical protein Q4C66_07160 [Lachnospiraceae bacterium]|nr:hypothetical protein [Lachnospiraceae bacterium]